MNRVRIGLITSTQFSDLYEDDRLAASELERRGHQVEAAIWNAQPKLEAFELVVMRTPWDWFHHRPQFRKFLESLSEVRVRVVNTPPQLLEFADKTYLRRLQAKGVAVVPTEQLAATDLHRVPQLLAEHDWTRAVLKPAFTANAVGARLFDASSAAAVLAEIGTPSDGEPWLLQPFIPSIAEGELSFIFFGGVFSHAVRKRPLPNEWRVQHEYGGQSAPHTPTAKEIEEATEFVAALGAGNHLRASRRSSVAGPSAPDGAGVGGARALLPSRAPLAGAVRGRVGSLSARGRLPHRVGRAQRRGKHWTRPSLEGRELRESRPGSATRQSRGHSVLGYLYACPMVES